MIKQASHLPLWTANLGNMGTLYGNKLEVLNRGKDASDLPKRPRRKIQKQGGTVAPPPPSKGPSW